MCSNSWSYEVVITVLDGATGKDVCDATVTIADGTYHEAPQAFGITSDGGALVKCNYEAARQRAGTYHVVVDRAGFKEATLDVTVTSDACGPSQEMRTMTLEPQ